MYTSIMVWMTTALCGATRGTTTMGVWRGGSGFEREGGGEWPRQGEWVRKGERVRKRKWVREQSGWDGDKKVRIEEEGL